MITVRYHYNYMNNGHMKCTDIFFSKKDFEAWYDKYKDQIKNLYII